MRKTLLKFIDFFHPPFSKWIPLNTFRYLATGGSTAVSGIIIYFISYNFILHQHNVQIGSLLVSAHIAALAIESVITFCIGFVLNKYIVFTKSTLKGRIQLFRYGTVVITNILLNYGMMKILVDTFHFYPTISKALITIALAIFSYFSQKHFTFKVKIGKQSQRHEGH